MSDNVELVARALTAVMTRDGPAVSELFHDDAEWHNTRVFPGPRMFRGPQAIIEFWDLLSENYEEEGFELQDAVERGDSVVAGLHSWGRGRGSGAPLDVRWAAVLKLREGRVARVDVYGTYERALDAV